MIQLNVRSLQEFAKLTLRMEKNTMLPVLSYLKLQYDDGANIVTKSNLNAICMANISGSSDEPYPDLLIDERILFGFISESSVEEIGLSFSDTQIKLTDGKTSIGFSREDPTNFPNTPEPTGNEEFSLTKEHLATISIARMFINEMESAGNFQFVHISNEYIAAFHTHHLYVNNRYRGLPDIMLNGEQSDVISSADQELKFSASGNHYFFTAPSVRYIFTRQEGKTPALDNVLERLKLPGKEFNIMKNDLLGFCNIANMVAETPISDCVLERTETTARLRLTDSNYSRDGRRDISVTGVFDDFNFNARLLANPLRSVPYDLLECKTNSNCLIIVGQNEYFCFIGMSKNK